MMKTAKSKSEQKVIEIPLKHLLIDERYQQRLYFDPEAMAELQESLRVNGMIQPILVIRDDKNPENFFIVDGGRRYHAATQIKMETIPAIEIEGDPVEQSIIANIIRSNYDPIEEARAIGYLMETHDLTQEEIAKKTGRKQSSISECLSILKIDEDVLNSYLDRIKTLDPAKGEKPLSKSVLMQIAKSKKKESQQKLMERALSEKLTAKQVGKKKGKTSISGESITKLL
ncbi:MAG: ParB/RepB/Spo0J family partition protein, partial [bacterium]|nr:ParB/RepB/Spo0J family partition protein [bacterium]